MEKKNTIAVVGLGYVGLPLALLADQKGYRVIGVDIDAEKVERLKRRESPMLDESVSRQLAQSNMEPTNDFARIADASIVIICVPTPVKEDHTPDFEPLKGAANGVGSYLERGQLVILESTVNPGVCETILLPILEERSRLKCGVDFDLAHCPERVNPGDVEWEVRDIPRVIGGFNPISLRRATRFYKSIIKNSIKPMGSLKEAEAVKIVENTFRDVNIAFVNELAVSFSRLGIDITRVIDGAATKPFGFMAFYPGAGVGGHCIPVDPYYLIKYAKENGFHHRFLTLAREINNDMPKYVVERLEESLKHRRGTISGATIAVLGVAYKPDIDDARESPALEIIRLLKQKGATVRIYDPYIKNRSTATSLSEVLRGADAVIVATAHSIFRKLRPHDLVRGGIQVVIDGRNCLVKEDFIKAGITYRGIGR